MTFEETGSFGYVRVIKQEGLFDSREAAAVSFQIEHCMRNALLESLHIERRLRKRFRVQLQGWAEAYASLCSIQQA